jgi:S1-C subfamily serine protease
MMGNLTYRAALALSCALAPWPALGQDDPQTVLAQHRGSIVLVYRGDLANHTRIGTGFVIRSDGTFVTSYRLLSREAPLIVRLANGEWYADVQAVDVDPVRGIAILRFKGFDVPTVRLGNSNAVADGAAAATVAVDDGLAASLVEGSISAALTADQGYRYFQTSLPFSDVMRGAPVFGTSGEVVGIASAPPGSNGALAAALPINYARGLNLDAAPKPLASVAAAPAAEATPPTDNAAVIARLNGHVERFHRLIDDAYDGASYDYQGVQVTRRTPNIYQAADRLRELAREAARLNEAAAADDSLKRIVADYAYLMGKSSQIANQMATAPTMDGMDYASTARRNILREDAPDLAYTFRTYVARHHPDLLDSLAPTVREGPINRKATYGIGIADTDSGVTVTAADGSKFFQVGDVILGTRGGPDFAHAHAFRKHVFRLDPGDRIWYRLRRDGAEVEVRATIGKR